MQIGIAFFIYLHNEYKNADAKLKCNGIKINIGD